MGKDIKVTIENKLTAGKRDLNVYRHSPGKAHMLRHKDSITLPLGLAADDDFLHISIVSGPGPSAYKSIVNLPSWVDFEFSSMGNVILTHSGDRTLLKIPPGVAMWQLKVTRQNASAGKQTAARVTIGDDPQGLPVKKLFKMERFTSKEKKVWRW